MHFLGELLKFGFFIGAEAAWAVVAGISFIPTLVIKKEIAVRELNLDWYEWILVIASKVLNHTADRFPSVYVLFDKHRFRDAECGGER